MWWQVLTKIGNSIEVNDVIVRQLNCVTVQLPEIASMAKKVRINSKEGSTYSLVHTPTSCCGASSNVPVETTVIDSPNTWREGLSCSKNSTTV